MNFGVDDKDISLPMLSIPCCLAPRHTHLTRFATKWAVFQQEQKQTASGRNMYRRESSLFLASSKKWHSKSHTESAGHSHRKKAWRRHESQGPRRQLREESCWPGWRTGGAHVSPPPPPLVHLYRDHACICRDYFDKSWKIKVCPTHRGRRTAPIEGAPITRPTCNVGQNKSHTEQIFVC